MNPPRLHLLLFLLAASSALADAKSAGQPEKDAKKIANSVGFDKATDKSRILIQASGSYTGDFVKFARTTGPGALRPTARFIRQ